MRKLLFIITFLLSCASVEAQLNYVKNPDFEEYTYCPTKVDQIDAAKFWNALKHDPGTTECIPEYCHVCNGTVPVEFFSYQYPRSGAGLAQVLMFDDETGPPDPPPYYRYSRDYLRGELYKKLESGKSYCVTFYANLTEDATYKINKIGAYLDDGILDTVSRCARPITFVTPQVYATSIIGDTANWTKIEGSFMANGTESYITIGNFFSKTNTTYANAPGSWSPTSHWSYYLIDDVSVIETNLEADAGIDKAVHIGDSVWVGRGLDSTKGLDCKWYYKGALADSGAGMYAKAGAVKGIDTYVVVQTICGLIKTDTALVYTFPVGINELPGVQAQVYSIYPNPSDGELNIEQKLPDSRPVSILIYNMQGRIIYRDYIQFKDKTLPLQIPDISSGLFIMQVTNHTGQTSFSRFTVQK